MVLPHWCKVRSDSPDTRVGSNSFWLTVFSSGWYFQIGQRTNLFQMKKINGSFLFWVHRFFSSIPGSPSKTRQFPLQVYCLSWLSKQTVYRLVFTHDLKDTTRSCLLHIHINYDLFLPWKLKKSGKEPKVGAEVTLGKLSHKTTVRYQARLKWTVFIAIVT